MLTRHPLGQYHFLAGIDPYSCGVIACPGYELIRIHLDTPLDWRSGFDFVDRYLRGQGLAREALCAMELRSPKPFSMSGFIEFNRGYREVLLEWNLLVAGINPIARTNVAPWSQPPSHVTLHAFSFVRPSTTPVRPTFVVAGAGELREGTLISEGIIRRGETSADALLEKARYVLDVMDDRLRGLGVGWDRVTAVNVYTVHPFTDAMRILLHDQIGPAARNGITWHITRPPVVDVEFEMDVRGLNCEQRS